MATIYLDNCSSATSVWNILTTSQPHHNRFMTCRLCLAMPRVSNISIISHVSPCLDPIWNVLARLVSWYSSLGKSLCLRKMFWLHHFIRDKAYHSEPNHLPAASLIRRFHRESALAGAGLYRVRHVFFLLFATAPSWHICHVSHAPLHRRSFWYNVYATYNLKYLAYLHIRSN